MQKLPTNYAKKMAKLRYKDKIKSLYKEGFTILEITKRINKMLAHTKLNTTLGKTTIAEIIKEQKNG